MKFISICSGIEAASVAFGPLGWKALAFSEIEPFPCAVLAHHYPEVPNFGDMTEFRQWPEQIFVSADAIVGGPPCQAFSVAGLRKGLDDARGNLTLTYAEMINHADAIRLRHGKPPVIVLYENVPGLLSDKSGAYGCFLAALAGEDDPLEPPGGGGWSNAGYVSGPQRTIAWRTLDAQYFGVAQRRRRVFVISSARKDFDPATVLFEFGGVRRDTAPSREAGQTATHATAPCLTSSGRGVERVGDTRGQDPVVAVPQPYAVANCLTARMHKGINSTLDEGQTPVVTHTLRGEGFDASEDGTGRGTPLVAVHGLEPCEFCAHPFNHDTLGRYGCPNCEGEGLEAEVQPMFLHVNKGRPNGRQSAHEEMVSVKPIVETLTTDGHARSAVAQPIAFSSKDYGGDAATDLSPTLRAMPHDGSHANGGGQMAVALAFQDRFRGDDGRGYGRVPPVSVEQIGTLETVKPWNVTQPIAFHPTQDPISSTDGTTHGLGCGSSGGQASVAVAFQPGNLARGAGASPSTEVFPTLKSDHGRGVSDQDPHVAVAHVPIMPTMTSGGPSESSHNQVSGQMRDAYMVPTTAMQVRRLTPVECERLQGFPDNYTAIPWRKKPASECPDGPRYKALGNSWAVPNVRWIGARIQDALQEAAQIQQST